MNKVIKIVITGIVAFSFLGCGKTILVHPNPQKNFNKDLSYCNYQALKAIPTMYGGYGVAEALDRNKVSIGCMIHEKGWEVHNETN